ncbi:MAG: N-acetyltransferase [Alphaproteobacteria bacterium]|nr:MAG: N-acetyltransferase [Alphaproteobacteria bacterium]
MAITEGLVHAILGPEDIDGAMDLVVEAGWNQIAEDWRLMCQAGEAIVLREDNGIPGATALALPYPGGFGWISMVLVTSVLRRKGLATQLLNDRVAWLQARGLVPVLDATEAGEQVYLKAGFATGLRFTRWQGERTGAHAPQGDIRVASETDLHWIQALDAAVFHADRGDIILDFLYRPGSKCFVSNHSKTGFIIARQGLRATQFGPLVADTEEEAIQLLDAALSETDGPVFFDLLDTRSKLAAHVASLGFEKQRGFARMSLGQAPDFDGGGRTMIIAGPEYG